MYDHIGLKVRDLDASVRFYEAALAPLGHVLGPRDDAGRGLRPSGRAGAVAPPAPTTRPAARARTWRSAPPPGRRSRASTRPGSRPAAATTARPGPRPDYGPTYYAAFLIDPDGNNVEAVCLGGGAADGVHPQGGR